MATPAAYLRKSKDSATKAEHLDRLLGTVASHGHNGDTVVYDDWARSGDQRKLTSRRAWRDLCAAIERGEHDVVFMNDLDRGGRSLEEWLRFIRVAQDHRVRVIAGDTDFSAPENKDRLIFEAWLAERELDAAKRRAGTTQRMRTKRGDTKGQPPYGYLFARAGDVGMISDEHPDPKRVVLVPDPGRPVQPLLEALGDAHNNIAEAVRLLNDRGVPSRYGKQWSASALRGTLRHLGAMPPETKKSRRTRSGRLNEPSAFSKLVRCHCGQIMTPVDSRGELYCRIGSRDGKDRHGRYISLQRRIYDYLRAELHYSKINVSAAQVDAGDVAERRVALEEKRRRLGVAYADGAMDDDEYTRRKQAITSELEALPEPDAWQPGPDYGKRTPLVDWDAGPAAIGEQLRRVVRAVQLDEEMLPVELELRPWTRPRSARKA